jgi:aryl-alcohol dehydrogenase-like predicted oxidoreductase
MNKDEVYSPVVGVSKIAQLDDLVGAAEIALEQDDIQYLEALYQPLQNLLSIGFS